MLFNLTGGFQDDIAWVVRSHATNDKWSLLGRGQDARSCDLHVSGLSAAQLHQLAQEILAKVPLPVAPPAPETETDPFADTATALAGT